MTTDEKWKKVGAALLAPFAEDEVEWKAQKTSRDKTRALAVAYIDARAVMDRLDAVVGPENWSDSYRPVSDKNVECTLTIFGVSKCDVGEGGGSGDIADPMKSAYSDAFKRAAVKWGIGRFLYALPAQWVGYDEAKKQLAERPKMSKAAPVAKINEELFGPEHAPANGKAADLPAELAPGMAVIVAGQHDEKAGTIEKLQGDFATVLVDGKSLRVKRSRLTAVPE